MKNRIKLHLAMVAALASAIFHRATNSNALALGNDAPTGPTADELAAENAKLRKENEALKAKAPKLDANAKLIRQKMDAGLSREQAEAAIKHQAAYDAKKKEAKE